MSDTRKHTRKHYSKFKKQKPLRKSSTQAANVVLGVDTRNHVSISNDSLISFCAPFNIPDDTSDVVYTVSEKRYGSGVDLSIIYGSLDSDIRSTQVDEPPMTNYKEQNKTTHLMSLFNTLSLIDEPLNVTDESIPIAEIPIYVQSNNSDTDDSESDIDSEIDVVDLVNIDFISNTILSANKKTGFSDVNEKSTDIINEPFIHSPYPITPFRLNDF